MRQSLINVLQKHPVKKLKTLELARLFFMLSEEQSNQVQDKLDQKGAQIQCKKGCGACCNQLVTISIIEACFLADFINQLPEIELKYVRDKLEMQMRRLQKADLWDQLWLLNDPLLDEKFHFQLAQKYFHLRMPCVFLKNDSCSIYLNRPIQCREYCVTSSASLCSDPFENPVKVIPLELHLDHLLSEIYAAKFELPPHPIPFPLALEWALENPQVSEEEFDLDEIILLLTANA